MDTPQAVIHLSLKECLQPTEIGELVNEAAKRGIDEGECIAVAVREFLSRVRLVSTVTEGRAE